MIYTDINAAFHGLCQRFLTGFQRTRDVPSALVDGWNLERMPSRNGDVLACTHPVLIHYLHPLQRILLYPARDANPFFHIMEALWMLSGSSDVTPLLHFNKRMEEYCDRPPIQHGAYGARWASLVPEANQLDMIVKILRDDPNSRRVVLQMWDAYKDLYPQYCNRKMKDVPCNTQIYFNLSSDHEALNMTVTNRSNDLIWGLLGANYVHFTVLQEYLAWRLGKSVGSYFHMTNNLHCYSNLYSRKQHTEELLKDWLDAGQVACGVVPVSQDVPYGSLNQKTHSATEGTPQVSAPETISLFKGFSPKEVDRYHRTLSLFLSGIHASMESLKYFPIFSNGVESGTWFSDVGLPMFRAFWHHKRRDYTSAFRDISDVKDDSLRTACSFWLSKRQQRYCKKS